MLLRRLAILKEAEAHRFYDSAAEGSVANSTFDSHRSLLPASSSLSDSGSLPLTASRSSLQGSLSAGDSSRSFAHNSSFGSTATTATTADATSDPGTRLSSVRNIRSGQNLAGDTIDEGSEGRPSRQGSVRSIPEIPPISSWNDFEHADFSNHGPPSRHSLSLGLVGHSISTGSLAKMAAAGHGPESRRFSIGDPFSHFRWCRKKKKCNTMCKCGPVPPTQPAALQLGVCECPIFIDCTCTVFVVCAESAL